MGSPSSSRHNGARSKGRKHLTSTELAAIPDLRTYHDDPLFSLVVRRGIPGWQLFFLCLTLFLFSKAIFALWCGVLTVKGLGPALAADLFHYPGIASIAGKFVAPMHIHGATVAAVPYLRDYSEILLMITVSAQMVLMRSLWYRLSVALPTLYDQRVLNPKCISIKQLTDLTNRYNGFLKVTYWGPLSIALGALLAAGTYYSAWNHGIYAVLNPENDAFWSATAYLNWWANPVKHEALFLWAFAVAVFICYYMIRNNIVGIAAVLLCRDLFSTTGSEREPILRININHEDDIGGLGVIRDIVRLGYFSVLNSIIALYLVWCCFGLGRFVIPLFIAFWLLNPIYALVPMILIRKQIRYSKSFELEKLTRRPTGRAKRLAREVKALPELLFSPSKISEFIVSQVFTAVLFVHFWINARPSQ